MQLYLPPWNMASYHLESIPKISLNLFYFPKKTTLNAPHIYLRQPLNSTLFQTPKKLPNAPNSSPNFAILVPSNAPLKTSQFYWLPTLRLNPLGSRTKFFPQNSNPPLVLAPLRKLRPFFLVCFLFFRWDTYRQMAWSTHYKVPC
jgi:hypothetical protein